MKNEKYIFPYKTDFVPNYGLFICCRTSVSISTLMWLVAVVVTHAGGADYVVIRGIAGGGNKYICIGTTTLLFYF